MLRPVDEKKTTDFGLGWYTELAASTHQSSTNAVLFGPILTAKFDKLSFTANPFLERTFGRNRVEGIAFSYGWQMKYELREGLAIGIEGFGVVENIAHSPRFQDQEHRIGPVIYTENQLTKDFKINVDVGVLFGLTEATPTAALKINLGVPLHQQAASRGR